MAYPHTAGYYPPGRIQWRTGTPPTPGWYPASVVKNPLILRWWNGKFWSAYVCPNKHRPPTLGRVAERARTPFDSPYNKNVPWSDPWWEPKAHLSPEP